MATMVCRGPQPCVDSQFIETTWPRIKLHPHPHPPPSLHFALNSCFLDLDNSSNSLPQCHQLNQILLNHNAINSLPPPPSPPPPSDDDDVSKKSVKSAMASKELQSDYVHPLVKRSRSALSDESLALCTENLGNETGDDFVEDVVFSDLINERSSMRKRVKSKRNQGNNKVFPPPLTTIAGVDSIRVRSYREDGRLIMEAVKTPARLSYFHVERSHGRLRLSILKSSTSSSRFDCGEESTEKQKVREKEKEEEEEVRRNDDVEVVGEKGNYEEDLGGKVEENGNLGGAEIEIEKVERPCRCNEAGENNNIDEIKNNNEMLVLTREPLSIWVSS
ncbi:protein FANTASTIC FOUR 3 [Cucumis sativus]|uniref:FAF domain-containing protein n=1 Tax=Cucumis sativus TaxID=3659 RepID=A0A0A0L8T9_CUCSA|nr:protein FANTASTIC FOUR 3 [Cucumis sativus]KGN57007.1 hypothetical protein Csa_010267 [Cucumis sativus]